MAVGRGLTVLRLILCFLLLIRFLTPKTLVSGAGQHCRPIFLLKYSCASSLKFTVLKQSKRGSNVVALFFDSHVKLGAYFAICCDVASNPKLCQ